jgi:translation initiation factor IF-2
MMPQSQAPPPAITRTISLAEGMTVKDLAEKLELRAKDVLKKLIERRMMLTINTTLDNETATMVAREFGADIEMRSYEEEMVAVESASAQDGNLVQRAPIVTVMGHVDHGKTTLLDAIRKARVAERESGGITQHIGAYTVEINDRRIVFLDTPGHEAFTLMRARGARVTDVVILVVAADDGVMPQTKEAIEHARAAKVPLVVAINKIDKANANPERVKTELSELGLTPEKWGGQTVTVEVSAKEQQNLDSLLEMLLLVTEMGELKANPTRSASGTVLEAKMDRGRGPVATVLVSDGTVRIGDNFIAGPIVGKVRALIDDRGDPQKEAGPSSPIEILGLTGLPQPGDGFQVVMDAAKARQIAMIRQNQARAKTLGTKGSRLTLESLQQQIAEGGTKELPIIVKADVQGSAEVLADALGKLGDDRVKVRLISSGAGAITEGDVVFAAASNAIIIGFNVRPDRNAAAMALREQIDIRLHRVIYDITDEVKKAMAGLLDPTVKEVKIGAAVVREVFKVPKFGAAAGSMVQEGKITRTGDTQARLLRDNVVIHEGRLGSLRRFKDDATEVKHGLECGIAFERYADIKVGDVIEVFTIEHIAATV